MTNRIFPSPPVTVPGRVTNLGFMCIGLSRFSCVRCSFILLVDFSLNGKNLN